MLSFRLNAIRPGSGRRRASAFAALLCAVWLAGCGEKNPPAGAGYVPKESAAFDAAAQAGQNALDQDQPALARSHFETALQAAADFPPIDPRVAMTWMYLGTATARAGDLPAAETALQRALELTTTHLPADTELLADIQFRLGDLYRQMGRADDADKFLARAAAYKPADSATALLQARILRSQALTALLLRGHPEQAEPLFQASLAKLAVAHAAAAPADNAEACALRNDYAACCLAQKKIDPAATALDEAAQLEKTNLADSRVAAETKQLQGNVEFARRHFAAAETLLTQAFTWFEKSVGPDAAVTLRAARDLAEAQSAAGHQAEALAQYETYATRYQARTTAPARGEPQAFAWVLNRLAGLYVQENQLEKALATLEKLQAFYVAHAGPDSPVVAQTWADRATVLRKLDRPADADAADAQAAAIRAKQPAPAVK